MTAIESAWKRFLNWRNNPPARKPDLNDESDWVTRTTADPQQRGLGYTSGEALG